MNGARRGLMRACPMRSQRRRRRLSMTSLIDVIFLLLLFFMLSSTFSRFAEVDLSAAGSSVSGATDRPVFVSLTSDRLRLNGADETLATLSGALEKHRADSGKLAVLVSLQGDVTAQRLTDLLGALRGLPGAQVTVLESA